MFIFRNVLDLMNVALKRQCNEFRDSVGFAKIAVAINWDSQQPSPDDEEDSRKYRQEYQPLKLLTRI